MRNAEGVERQIGLPEVAILMATYEGQRFLPAQLESILAQTCKNWTLWVSDDSTELATGDVLDGFAVRMEGRLKRRDGPHSGVVANFLTLVCSPDVRARFYAFADQDDVWDEDKLARGLAWISGVPSDVPALYCGRTRLIDEDGRLLGLSPLFRRQPGFGNALVQSLAGGNTMLFNEAARRLLLAAGKDVEVPVHDWWLYLLVTGSNGVVYYDPHPTISYRQHGGNLIGGNVGWSMRLARTWGALTTDRHRAWHDGNVQALIRVRDGLSEESRACLDAFVRGRQGGLMRRVIALRRAGVYRQTWQGTCTLWMWILLGKI